MEQLIKHLVREDLESIVKSSLLNCHAIGVHSIMLLDAPEKRIRMYIATKEHQIYGNVKTAISAQEEEAMIAFHPHHCNLTISVICGELTNWVITDADEREIPGLQRYLYRSQITDGAIGFQKLKNRPMELAYSTLLMPGQSLYMDSQEVHSVSVPKGLFTAWFVFEGKEDADYIPESYSFSDMEQFSHGKPLYLKPTQKQIIEFLQEVGML